MVNVEPTPTVGPGPSEGLPVSLHEFGELLRGFRERAGLTQGAAADEIGVSRPTVVQWEAGRYLPAPENAARLDQLLGAGTEISNAANAVRRPQRPRPVAVAAPTPAPVVTGKPLLQVFGDVRSALLGRLVHDGDGHPLGWPHYLVPDSDDVTPLSTAYGLKGLALLGGLDPRTTALVGTLRDLAERDSDGRILGWRARTSAAPRIETTAVVFDALRRVGADLDPDDVVRCLSDLLDDVARTRPLVLTTTLDALLGIAPGSALAEEVVGLLLDCRVEFPEGLLWPEKRVESPQPGIRPSVAHTARAVNALRHAADDGSRAAVADAERWLIGDVDLGGVSESIVRVLVDGRAEELAFHSFTSAHVARALAGMAEPPAAQIRRALEVVWERYQESLHLWAWGNGDVPVWMIMDAINALNDTALAMTPTPVRPGE